MILFSAGDAPSLWLGSMLAVVFLWYSIASGKTFGLGLRFIRRTERPVTYWIMTAFVATLALGVTLMAIGASVPRSVLGL